MVVKRDTLTRLPAVRPGQPARADQRDLDPSDRIESDTHRQAAGRDLRRNRRRRALGSDRLPLAIAPVRAATTFSTRDRTRLLHLLRLRKCPARWNPGLWFPQPVGEAPLLL